MPTHENVTIKLNRTYTERMMKCGVIIDNTASHFRSSDITTGSVAAAIKNGTGPFVSVEIFIISQSDPDLKNASMKLIGLGKALNAGCEWIIYLNSGDLLFDDAFQILLGLTSEYDAIWGLQCEALNDSLDNIIIKPVSDNLSTSFGESLKHFDIHSVESGFFVKTNLAYHLFIDDQACGAYFQHLFYLELLEKHRCKLLNSPIFIAIQSNKHSPTFLNFMRYELQRREVKNPVLQALKINPTAIPPTHKSSLFAVVTLVSDPAAYDHMLQSFETAGFNQLDAKFLYIVLESTESKDTYKLLNLLGQIANAKYILYCNQYIRFAIDDVRVLIARLSELNDIDPNWALAGNAGSGLGGSRVQNLTSDSGSYKKGVFPNRVFTLDDHFMIARGDRSLSFSHDLHIPYFYGTDICLHADMLGLSAYAIDFHLVYLGIDKMNGAFFEAKRTFEKKWSKAVRSRFIQTRLTIIDVENADDQVDCPCDIVTTHKNKIFQICYDESTLQNVPPGFIGLENQSSQYPDWFEFDPIRRYIESTSLSEDTFYGFLSPKFSQKTGYTSYDLIKWIEKIKNESDVVLVSSHTHGLVMHKNPFLHGERFQNGIISAMEKFMDSIGAPIHLDSLVTNLNNSVLSNFIIAKPLFWREWYKLANSFFDFVERSDLPVARLLNQPAQYKFFKNKYTLKVFAQERLATIVLVNGNYRVSVPDFFKKFKFYDNDMRLGLSYLERMKTGYIQTKDKAYLDAYETARVTGKIPIE